MLFSELFTERRFHLLIKFLNFINNEHYEEAICSSRRLCELKPILDHLSDRFSSADTPECEVSADEPQMV